jgi:hypothetical protein
MSTATATTRLLEIIVLADGIEAAGQRMGLEKVLNGPAFQKPTRLSPAELGFIRVVSWLYVYYEEVGRASLSFLSARLAARDPARLSGAGGTPPHRQVVNDLRTYLQHGIAYADEGDRAVAARCADWFRRVCGTPTAATAGHWERCLNCLLVDAVSYWQALLETAEQIEVDDRRP